MQRLRRHAAFGGEAADPEHARIPALVRVGLQPQQADAGNAGALQGHDESLAEPHRRRAAYTAPARVRAGMGTDIDTTLEEAIEQFRRGDAAGAEAGFRGILARDPEHVEALNNLGVVLRARGQVEAALECYVRALRIKPGKPEYYKNIGNALCDKGMVDEAVACYLRGAKLLRGARRTDEAVQVCKLAAQYRPDYPGVRFELGLSLLRQGLHAEAQAQFEWVAENAAKFASLARFVGEGRSVAEVEAGGESLRFRVSPGAENLGLASYHVNGLLYEAAELEHCRALVAPGAAIVDVGANIGNHLVYFAKVLKARIVVPVEPHPDAIAQLLDNIALNGLDCVDTSCLGRGAGEARARFRLVEGVDLAQAALAPSEAGEVEVAPLDELIAVPVDFIKIDVERGELGVLKGARGLIARHRPLMLVEVADANLEGFRGLLDELGYAVQAEFPHRGYRNCFVAHAR